MIINKCGANGEGDDVEELKRKSSLVMFWVICEVITKSFRTGRLVREMQMVQLSATRCSCIAIL